MPGLAAKINAHGMIGPEVLLNMFYSGPPFRHALRSDQTLKVQVPALYILLPFR